MSKISRRSLVTTAAALPVLVVPAVAHASACTLPPDLIERFLSMRAWYLKEHASDEVRSREHHKRFEAVTGVTRDQYDDMGYRAPRKKELEVVSSKIWKELQRESGLTNESEEAEISRLCDERWAVAEAMMAHEPQSIVDVAWQLEAWLIADLEVFNVSEESADVRLFRMFVEHVRTLGGVPQPEDPFGALSLVAGEAVRS
jgi:hypothetical protein